MISAISKLFSLPFSSGQRVAKNTFWLLLGEVLGRIIRFSIVVYSTRLLGPSEYGVFAYVMAVNAFLVIFSDIGLSAILTREVVRNDEKTAQRYIASSLALKLILTIVNVGILIFLVPLFTRIEGALALLPLVALVLVFDSLREFAFGLNRAFERMDREAFSRIVLNTVIAGLGFYLLVESASAQRLIYAYIIGSFVGAFTIIFLLRDKMKRAFSVMDVRLFVPLLKAAAPIGLLGLLTSITLNTDLIMLGFWRSSVELGYFALAQKIILLLYVLPTLLASAAFPRFVATARDDKKTFEGLLEKSILFALMLVIPMAIGGIILSEGIVLFFGSGFAPAAGTLAILLVGLIIIYPSTIIANALTALDKQNKFLTFVAIGAIGNFFFNLLLIPSYGIEGAAVSSLLTQIAANLFVWFEMKKEATFSVVNKLSRILFASIGVAILSTYLLSLGIHTLAIIGLSMVLYFAMLYLLNEPLITAYE